MGSRRGVLLDAALVTFVVLIGLLSGTGGSAGRIAGSLAALAVTATATGCARRRPALALALIWSAGLAVVLVGRVSAAFELAVLIVAFCTARYGSRATIVAAAVSVPLGAGVALALALGRPLSVARALPETELLRSLVDQTGLGLAGAALVVIALLASPWALGLLFRANERYRRAEQEHRFEQAQIAAVADARAAQTRLTRDVHDVVGHSLAVIIAQADAARFAAEDADPRVREALDRIATVGRSSLAEVRDVLSRTSEQGQSDDAEPNLSELIAGVRAAGHEIVETVSGEPVPLDPAVASAAYRVLQELLTNAIKHGSAGTIEVDRTWTSDALTLRVTNPAEPHEPLEGMGLTGIRSRLAALGGTLRTAQLRGRFVAVVQLRLSR